MEQTQSSTRYTAEDVAAMSVADLAETLKSADTTFIISHIQYLYPGVLALALNAELSSRPAPAAIDQARADNYAAVDARTGNHG